MAGTMTKSYIDQSTPRRKSRNPLRGLTPEEAAGLMFIGILLAIGMVIGGIIGFVIGQGVNL